MCEGVFSSLMSFFNFLTISKCASLWSNVHSPSWKISRGQTVSVIWQDAQNATFSLKPFSPCIQTRGHDVKAQHEDSGCSQQLINLPNTSNWADMSWAAAAAAAEENTGTQIWGHDRIRQLYKSFSRYWEWWALMAKTVGILLRNQEQDVKAETTPPDLHHGPTRERRTRLETQNWDFSSVSQGKTFWFFLESNVLVQVWIMFHPSTFL